LDAEIRGDLAVSSEVVSAAQWISYLDSANRQRTAGGYFTISKNKLGAMVGTASQSVISFSSDNERPDLLQAFCRF